MRCTYYILILILFSFNKIFACGDILPGNPNKIKVPTMNTGQTTGLGGITDFSSKNDDCTLDCQCVYNSKTASWEVKVLPKYVCVFMNQCTNCKGKECEIRFVDLQTSILYKKTFFADDPNKSKIEKCYQKPSEPVKCEEVPNLPSYNEVKPLN